MRQFWTGGQGSYGALEMGGMFSVLKVRRDQKAGDYKDPGWYKQPKGMQAYEWQGQVGDIARSNHAGSGAMPARGRVVEQAMQVRKPLSGHGQH